MTNIKPPEELKLNRLYYVKRSDGNICIRRTHLFLTTKTEKALPIIDFEDVGVDEVLAPVPTYDEYKAMQAELDEFKRSVTSYIGKPINYDIACETVNKLLDDIEKLKKELAEHRENCCCLENERLRLDKAKFEEENNKLSDLLKDIKLFFEECNPHDFTVVADNMDVYLTHINEVLK